MSILRLYLAQINPTVGDLKGNYNIIASHIEEAKKNDVDVVIFPELSITGYPPEDLLLKTDFVNENIKYLYKLQKITTNIVAVIGFVNKEHDGIYNSAAVLHNKGIKSIYNKQFLPNYSVFDEERYFKKGSQNYIYKIAGILIGINICEDIYYSSGPTKIQSIIGGAELVINISASPYHTEKIKERGKILFTRAVENRVNIAYVNLVGGQDELVFDGNSLIINEKGDILRHAKPFKEDALIYDLDTGGVTSARLKDTKFKNQKTKMEKDYSPLPIIDLKYHQKKGRRNIQNKIAGKYNRYVCCTEDEILQALILGTSDYVKKNRFEKVVIALSGGIDSALTAVIAVFALGKENVSGILMPSIYSSRESINDAKELSDNLGIGYTTIPISDIYSSYLENLSAIFKHSEINVTKENIQARIRGNIIMAAANENGWLVLSTGNKSEISVGYCTLYGDMVGGFSPIKDVYKTMVYRICRYINKKYSNIIPKKIITKVPSAELKPNQKDEDKLPPYKILDPILKAYIEDDLDYHSIVKKGFEGKTVREVINMVDFNEYKRRQGSPGIKITPRAFGKDRRYPITNNFKL
ncbi:MAG: NAD+ synthase [Candidatus Hydromicrobium americanum]|nr:MAG: NAD+ synthase [Candidatus Hydromicrobium americanum]